MNWPRLLMFLTLSLLLKTRPENMGIPAIPATEAAALRVQLAESVGVQLLHLEGLHLRHDLVLRPLVVLLVVAVICPSCLPAFLPLLSVSFSISFCFSEVIVANGFDPGGASGSRAALP